MHLDHDDPTRAAGEPDHDVGLFRRIAERLMPVDQEEVVSLVDRYRIAGRATVKNRVVTVAARRSAVSGAVSGLPGGLLAIALMGFDARGAFGATASISAAKHYFDDPAFFEQEDWWKTVASDAVNAPSTTWGALGRGAVPRAIAFRGARWGVKRAAVKVVPVAGALVGAALNYAWVRREGDRIFDGPQDMGKRSENVLWTYLRRRSASVEPRASAHAGP